MSTILPTSSPMPVPLTVDTCYRLSVEQYHEMAEAGILRPEDRVELVEGVLVQKMTISPLHAFVTDSLVDALNRLALTGWCIRAQQPITLLDGEPEPDVVVARGRRADYLHRHPTPADVSLVVEVADTSLPQDRGLKKRTYAKAGIPTYWIVNLVDKVVEIYAEPMNDDYRKTTVFKPGEKAALSLGGKNCGEIEIHDLFGEV